MAEPENAIRELPQGPHASAWDFRLADVLVDDHQPAVLLVDASSVNRRVVRGVLKDEGYRILESSQAAEALELLHHQPIDLVVLDLMMPEVSGLDFCRAIKQDRETRWVPVLILSSVQGDESEIAGIASGADEFLVQPLRPELLRTRVRAMLRHKSAIDSLEEAENILFTLAQAVEYRDRRTFGHCQRLADLSVTLGIALDLPNNQLLALHRGGYLHDIGKISVPDAILFKPGPLTPEEWTVMRMHTVRGEEIWRSARTLSDVLPIIRQHHECRDGSGYPDRLKGDRIPRTARVLQIADIFDALTSVRPYKPVLPAAESLPTLEAEAGRGWSDQSLVRLLRRLCELSPEEAAAEGLVPWPTPEPLRVSLENLGRAVEH